MYQQPQTKKQSVFVLGKAVSPKQGKKGQYWALGIKHKNGWLNANAFSQEQVKWFDGIKENTAFEFDLYKEEYQGKTYWKFQLPKIQRSAPSLDLAKLIEGQSKIISLLTTLVQLQGGFTNVSAETSQSAPSSSDEPPMWDDSVPVDDSGKEFGSDDDIPF